MNDTNPEGSDCTFKQIGTPCVQDGKACVLGGDWRRIVDLLYEAIADETPPPMLPDPFGLCMYLSELYSNLLEMRSFARSLSQGDHSCPIQMTGFLQEALNKLQENLHQLTSQTQRIAESDDSQRFELMGEFFDAFNAMADHLSKTFSRLQKVQSDLAHRNALLLKEVEALRRSEVALQESERRYRLLADHATDVIWTMSIEGQLTYVSPSVESHYGYTVEEMLTRNVPVLCTDQSCDVMRKTMEELLASVQAGKSVRLVPLEIEEQRSDGSTFWSEVMLSCLRDPDGKVSGILGVTRSIEVRKQLEARERGHRIAAEALHHSSSVLNSIGDQSELLDAILGEARHIVPSDMGCLLLVNGQLARIVRAVHAGNFEQESGWAIPPSPFQIADVSILREISATQCGQVAADISGWSDWLSRKCVENIRCGIAVPMVAQQVLLGFIVLGRQIGSPLALDHLDWLMAFASQAALALQNIRRVESLQELATIDPLTGLLNRRGFMDRLDTELTRAQRYRRPISLLMIDMDGFKTVNDTHGHIVGDYVLRVVSEVCLQQLRGADAMGRYGGDELIVIMPETDLDQAARAADRICRHVQDQTMEDNEIPIRMTVSIGVCAWVPNANEELDKPITIDMLVDQADTGLYTAKRSGGNQVCVCK